MIRISSEHQSVILHASVRHGEVVQREPTSTRPPALQIVSIRKVSARYFLFWRGPTVPAALVTGSQPSRAAFRQCATTRRASFPRGPNRGLRQRAPAFRAARTEASDSAITTRRTTTAPLRRVRSRSSLAIQRRGPLPRRDLCLVLGPLMLLQFREGVHEGRSERHGKLPVGAQGAHRVEEVRGEASRLLRR